MKIEILLSTYNGEKYLAQLLDSLLNQNYDHFHITVRDDGSKDGTISILEEYSTEHPDKVTFLRDGKNLGYPDCFWYLLKSVEDADLYAYCDQDDVWDEAKLSSCAEMCGQLQTGHPALYVHDYLISDEELNLYGEHCLAEEGFNPENTCMTIFYVMTQGFTMIMNSELRQRILANEPQGKNLPHDRWTFWAGMISGDIVYDSRKLAIYRRHRDSVTQTGKSTLIILKEWWREDVVGKRFGDWCRQAECFVSSFRQELGETVASQWLLIAGRKKGFINYWHRLFFPKHLKPSFSGELALRILFLLNKR